MTISDLLFMASGGLAVAAVGAGVYALWGWHRRLTAYRAFQELDAEILADIKAYPFLRLEADERAAAAKAARDAHKASVALSNAAIEARRVQLLCEQRLKAAGYDIVLGEVA